MLTNIINRKRFKHMVYALIAMTTVMRMVIGVALVFVFAKVGF